MKNLYIDPATNDLILDDDYNLRMTSDLTEYVAQKIENILRTFKNEWFLDRDLGIPYFDRILIKNADLDDVNSLFINAIKDITEISEISEYNTSFDRANRIYAFNFKAVLTNGEILESEVTV